VLLALEAGRPGIGVSCVIALVILCLRWSNGYLLWLRFLRFLFYCCLFSCFLVVVWGVSAGGGVFECLGATIYYNVLSSKKE
jgi:hypothetical protein